jgi:hypothetical protein
MTANQSRRRAGPDSAFDAQRDEDAPPADQKTAPTSELPSYVYKALGPDDCTRFVGLEPNEDSQSPLICRLREIAFGDIPKYEALSYRWGDDSENSKETLRLITDEGEVQTLAIGQNLADAMHFFRAKGMHGLFWIDAICINQADVQERNRQLKMMPHIYFRAQTVLVWLGKAYARYNVQLHAHVWQMGQNVADEERFHRTVQEAVRTSCRPQPTRHVLQSQMKRS